MDEKTIAGEEVLRDKWGSVTPETKEFASGWTTLLCLWCAQIERLNSGDMAQSFHLVQVKVPTGRWGSKIVSQWKCSKCFPIKD